MGVNLTSVNIVSRGQGHVMITSFTRWTAWVLGAGFAGLGLIRLLPVESDQAMFVDWGLPMWLRAGAAIAELVAGALLFFPKTRAIGAVGVFTIMVAAGTVHAALGHNMFWAALYCGLP